MNKRTTNHLTKKNYVSENQPSFIQSVNNALIRKIKIVHYSSSHQKLVIYNFLCQWRRTHIEIAITFHLFIYTLISVTFGYHADSGVRSLPRAPMNDHCWESNPRPFNHCDWVCPPTY